MRTLIIGGDSFLGKALHARIGGDYTSRRPAALIPFTLGQSDPASLLTADVIYLVAAITKFRECELDQNAYSVNVDAPIAIAASQPDAHIVYLSSEAAEWPNQTAYGALKRACEQGLLAVCGYQRLAVVRPKRISPTGVDDLCAVLERIGRDRKCGVVRWEEPPRAEPERVVRLEASRR